MKSSDGISVFISYAQEDLAEALAVYDWLSEAGLQPWIADKDLLPGQPWRRTLAKAIRRSTYFLALLSSKSVSKQGYVQKEIRIALEVFEEMSPETVWIIPLRIEECRPAHPRLEEIQWVDLFPSREEGLRRLLVGMGLDEPQELRPTAEVPEQSSREHDPKLEAPASDRAPYKTDSVASLDIALEQLGSGLKETFTRRLSLLASLTATDRLMASNLMAERHLPVSTLKRLVQALVSCSEAPDQLRGTIRRFCGLNLLRGSPIRQQHGVFVFPTSFDVFCRHLAMVASVRSVGAARRLVGKLVRAAWAPATRFASVSLSHFIMWTTRVTGGEVLSGTAEEVVAALGLEGFRPGDRLLLFEYELPGKVVARFPTFCDAYASASWPHRFRPAPSSAPHGLSVPTSPLARPVPEAVHEPILLRDVGSVRVAI